MIKEIVLAATLLAQNTAVPLATRPEFVCSVPQTDGTVLVGPVRVLNCAEKDRVRGNISRAQALSEMYCSRPAPQEGSLILFRGREDGSCP